MPLTCAGLAKRYGGLQVYAGVDLEVERNDRLAVVGKNGAGKSTLMRSLAGAEEPTAGTIRRAVGLRQAYFAQDQERQLDPGLTVLETVQAAAARRPSKQKVRDLLGAFLFGADDVDKTGGRAVRRRAGARGAGAAAAAGTINLLLLDEPTNHLDIVSTEALARALEQYRGTLIVVSHDPRVPAPSWSPASWRWTAARARLYPGDFSYYEWKRRQRGRRRPGTRRAAPQGTRQAEGAAECAVAGGAGGSRAGRA